MNNRKGQRMNTLRAAFVALLFAAPALAQDLATGEAIRAAISGNTVQGSMTSSGGYTEFYAADGAIKGEDYSGTWAVEGDKMCFTYGTDPATCWNVGIAGDAITWLNGGAEEGIGVLLPGNPNNF
jgi:hypothetical protein